MMNSITSRRSDHAKRRPSGRFCRFGFTLIELAQVTFMLSVLSGILLPAIVKVREAAQLQHAEDAVERLSYAMHGFNALYNHYPESVEEFLLMHEIYHQHYHDQMVPQYLLDELEFSEQHPGAFPYYIISVAHQPDEMSDKQEFLVVAGAGDDPRFSHTADTTFFSAGEANGGSVGVSFCEIYRDHARVLANPDGGGEYLWYWKNPGAQPVNPRRIPQPQTRARYPLDLARLTVRAAELATPVLEHNPEIATQIRAYSSQTDNLLLALAQYTPDAVAPFSDILEFDSVNDVPEIDVSQVEGRPDFLFSYDALRILSSYYCSDAGSANSLMAKLDAAEAAENRGQKSVKANQLKAFLNETRAQTGHSLSAEQARTLRAIAGTL